MHLAITVQVQYIDEVCILWLLGEDWAKVQEKTHRLLRWKSHFITASSLSISSSMITVVQLAILLFRWGWVIHVHRLKVPVHLSRELHPPLNSGLVAFNASYFSFLGHTRTNQLVVPGLKVSTYILLSILKIHV